MVPPIRLEPRKLRYRRSVRTSLGHVDRRSGADLTPFQAVAESVRADGGELVEQVSALIERTQLVAADSFHDPYFLDFLGLKDAYAECDLEEAIVRDLESSCSK